jgi:hypothetical protein
MKKHTLGWVISLSLAVYISSYGVLYLQRKPAGNMFYFQYLDSGPAAAERVISWVFYPVSWIHTRVFSGQKHVWDRPAPVDDPLALTERADPVARDNAREVTVIRMAQLRSTFFVFRKSSLHARPRVSHR